MLKFYSFEPLMAFFLSQRGKVILDRPDRISSCILHAVVFDHAMRFFILFYRFFILVIAAFLLLLYFLFSVILTK